MQFTVSKPPSVVSRGCTKCRVCKVQRNVVGHTKQDKQFVSSKDAVSNAVLGLTLSATILTNCGAVLAEEYADEMFKIVQERSGPPLEVQEAPVVSEREKRFQKLREELVEEEKSKQKNVAKEVVPEQSTSKPSLEELKQLTSQFKEAEETKKSRKDKKIKEKERKEKKINT
eukprot:TRINITY_DN2977_c0_g1_i3.p3 TRINITY_DN2977_c0_g1~~TRINITY_DN2977_c0_g1_i3.p3  ORF type:complete len:172 (-),score=27.93 TRINITY_DN2977_c0_g1_i3:19-534(-)